MRYALLATMVAATLSACGQIGPTSGPPTDIATAAPARTESAPTAAPTSQPASTATPAATPVPPTPTPTSFAEGLVVRLTTPDPNPNCPAQYPWFFENPADECADVVHNTWTVMQPFEHGLMVWSQERGQTWVLLDDGGPFKPYQAVSDPLGVPLPEPDPSLNAPEGLYQPERGFALFWRNLVPGHGWVRERLGWATAPETAYSAFWQCNTAGGNAGRCYFSGPGDELIVMATGSAAYWRYVQRAVR